MADIIIMLAPVKKSIPCCLSHQNPLSRFSLNSVHISLRIHKTLIDGLDGRVHYLWIIVMFLSAVLTLILTAPIHFRGSIEPNPLSVNSLHFDNYLKKIA